MYGVYRFTKANLQAASLKKKTRKVCSPRYDKLTVYRNLLDSFGYLKKKTNKITLHSHFIYNATTISLYIVYISGCILYYLLFICILLATLIFYFI